MKLQQLRYLVAIVHNNLNISAAAESLYTSQPGVSKQIRLLEDELGIELFQRNGKHLTDLTPVGRRIVERSERMLQEARNIKVLAAESRDDRRGNLSIATTHTQARYALPEMIGAFRKRYPEVTLQLHQGSPTQIAELAATGEVDFAIATEAIELFEDLIMMPCYRWNRCIIVPDDHPLTRLTTLTLDEVARYPLVTYVFGFTGRSRLDDAFRSAGLTPNVVFTATDADVIKTYVRLGLGVGIVASMAMDTPADDGLVCLDASHLFAPSTTRIGFRRGMLLREYMYFFIELFAPHLNQATIDDVLQKDSAEQIRRYFETFELPLK